MKTNLCNSMTKQELRNTNGGILVPVIAIAIGYACAAASFIYNMGKDGKSGVSNGENE